MRTRRLTPAGFTVVELIIAMASSIVIIGALLGGAIGLHKSMRATEDYATRLAEQRRLIGYVARDLRRSLSVASRGAEGGPQAAMGAAILVTENTSLEASLPGYYRSNTPGSTQFEKALPIVMTPTGADYGENAKTAERVTVGFRKIFVAAEKGVCFVREEAGASDVIVRDARDLHLRATVSADGRTVLLESWFRAAYSGARPTVSSFDHVMLRNLREEEAP